MAGSGEPASSFLKKRGGGTSGVTTTTNWSHSAGAGGKATTETRIVNDGSVVPFLAPDSQSGLEAAAVRYEQIIAAGGWPSISGGKLKKGAGGKSVAALNRRLHVEGYLRKEATEGEFAEVFTTATEDALMRFQRNMGLFVSGTLDTATQRELNVSPERRLATIRANLPRVTEYARDLGNRYVVVNVPAAQIETVSDGRVYSIHNAIVGRESRPTPVVMTALSTVRFNPYWNAPASIVEKDLIPRMTSGGAGKVMRDMNMKIFKGVGGPEIDPDSVSWRRAVADDYHFRQEPGGANAMATAKIEFNSPFGIYLHDTPEPHLFDTGARFYSSGCVRVQNVPILINWLLRGQDGIDAARVSNLAETKERLDVTIASAPQLRVVYLTAFPSKDGTVGFRPDIYQLDKAGFVVGQPLPVGETMGGQRFVLKPVPRLQQGVADNDGGFFSLFGSRNPDKQSGIVARSSAGSDALIKTKSKTAAKTAARKKLVAASARPAWFGRRNGENVETATSQPVLLKKKKLAKAATKKKTLLADGKAPAKKLAIKDKEQAVAAAKKPGDAKKPTASACKPGADGKLPNSCKPKVASAKKPLSKPQTTTAAN